LDIPTCFVLMAIPKVAMMTTLTNSLLFTLNFFIADYIRKLTNFKHILHSRTGTRSVSSPAPFSCRC
jgi:hypothetical protein